MLKNLKKIGYISVLMVSQQCFAIEHSMYLATESFSEKTKLLPITIEEAKAKAEAWRSLMQVNDISLLKAYRSDSYLEYDLRAIGGVYSYYIGKAYYAYLLNILRQGLVSPEEYSVINCNYSQLSDYLVVEQCALPLRQKRAQSHGIMTVPLTYTYIEIQKDTQGVFSVKNRIYVKKEQPSK